MILASCTWAIGAQIVVDEAANTKSCLLERPTSRGHTRKGVPGRIQAATCADERFSTSQSSGLWGRFLSHFHSQE
jgi:hypothetical protein